MDKLLWHFNLRNEYLFTQVCTSHDQKLMTIVDANGCSLRSLTKEVISFLAKSGKLLKRMIYYFSL